MHKSVHTLNQTTNVFHFHSKVWGQCVFLEINTFIQQGCIKINQKQYFNKMYNATKDFCLK